MEYSVLGNTGVEVSELCLGTLCLGWTADDAESFEILTTAYEAGINFLDTANHYSRRAPGNSGGEAETMIGKWLKSGVARRDEMIIISKVRAPMGDGPNEQGLSRSHIIAQAESSLKRLGTDYIDFYLPHWVDEKTDIEDSLTALDLLVRRGDVRYIGCSNFPAWRYMQALWTSDERRLDRFVSLQTHYNIVQRDGFERELEPMCLAYGLGVTPYSPLAEGFLTGKYHRGEPASEGSRVASSRFDMPGLMANEQTWQVIDSLRELGEERGKTVSQMAIGWLLTRPSITSPIIGPRSVEQLQDYLGAVGLRLTSDEMSTLDDVSDWR